MTSIAPITSRPALACAALLTVFNLFMNFAWYGHRLHLQAQAWRIAVLIAWFGALFEHIFQVPANRIGYTTLSPAQLRIMQEIVALTAFVPFAVAYMDHPLRLDFVWAGRCLPAVVYFIFRD